jgi:ribosome biogenesis GTPase / thiamine phosphate phosphatase
LALSALPTHTPTSTDTEIDPESFAAPDLADTDEASEDTAPYERHKPKKLDGHTDPGAGRTEDSIEGLVTEGSRGQYWVDTAQGRLLCTLRGKLRKNLVYANSSGLKGTTFRHKVRRANVVAKDPVAVGDRVRVVPMGANKGMIDEILPRESGSFTREDAGVSSRSGKGTVTSVAGIDQLVLVFAARHPEPHLRLLDRLLVLAEAQQLAPVICLNKVDLGPDPALLERLEYYRGLGYPVLAVSAEGSIGIPALRQLLGGHTSALVGPSGVGKSSLLNAIEPDLSLRVSRVSDAHHKGRHTTTGTRVVPLEAGDGYAAGYVADTAGIRALALGSAAAGKLDWCFRELRPFLGLCHLNDCLHVHEPRCAVRTAVERGEVDAERYESYRRLVEQGAASPGRNWKDVVESKSVVGEGDFRL